MCSWFCNPYKSWIKLKILIAKLVILKYMLNLVDSTIFNVLIVLFSNFFLLYIKKDFKI